MALRIVVGGDNAGFNYKQALRKDLESDERVEVVADVGVDDPRTTRPIPTSQWRPPRRSPEVRPTGHC